MAGLLQQGKELANYFGNYFGDVAGNYGDALSSLFNPPPVEKSPQPTREMTKNRLLDSIYKAEGGETAKVAFGQTEHFKKRTDRGEKIPYEEARAETSKHIDRHIKRWEEGGSRNVLNAKERGLTNANPEKNEAIIDGEWNPDFLKWYGEIYAPAHPANTTLRLAEKELNKNWIGNVSAGLNVPLAPPPQQMQPQVGLPPQFAMENIGNIDPQRMPPQQQIPLQQLNKQYPFATRQMLEDYHLSGLRADRPQQPTLQQPPLKLGEPTGEYTPEGRPLFWNNRGGKSSEYSTGVKDERINNNLETHIPSIYDGRILNQEDAIQRVVDANGYDPLTGRFIEPGGDPEARSGSLQSIPHHIGGATTGTSRYRQQRLPSLEEAAATAQVQPVLDPFPWLRETYDRRSKVGMYPPKKMFKSRSMYPLPKK